MLNLDVNFTQYGTITKIMLYDLSRALNCHLELQTPETQTRCKHNSVESALHLMITENEFIEAGNGIIKLLDVLETQRTNQLQLHGLYVDYNYFILQETTSAASQQEPSTAFPTWSGST
ncbi:hypothetical protein XENOCAPTIV_027911 [Xenoophorus captivus]|uniref:Uncharacterized protein n=1 Tax=Xenoophorus captivus TaxID=1517983 RepID=A0ABV0RNV4_9TELE